MKKYKLMVMIIIIVTVALVGCAKKTGNVDQKGVTDSTEDIKKEVPKSDETLERMENKGELASDFKLLDTNGNTHSLADYKGEKVYLKFWASWCSICLAGLGATDELTVQAEGFKVITIVSPGYKGEKVEADFLEWYNGLDMKNLIVLLDEGGTMFREYGVRGFPTSSYIGSDGVLIQTLPGHIDNDAITEKFQKIY